MEAVRRRSPPGVEPKERIELRTFLPYRIHRLSSKLAMPPPFELPDGRVVRAREWRVILQLAAWGPLTNRELADLVGMDAATITRVVQSLGELGLVQTKTSPSDRRKQFVSLTREGAAAHDLIAPGRRAGGEAIAAAMSPKEQAVFFALLDRLDARLDELGARSDDLEWDA